MASKMAQRATKPGAKNPTTTLDRTQKGRRRRRVARRNDNQRAAKPGD